MADELDKKRATHIKIGGIGAGLVLITIGVISMPRIGNYSMLFTIAGISIAVFAFAGASLRRNKS